MANPPTNAAVAASSPPPAAASPSALAKAAAILEVLLAFAFVHVAFRALKHFTIVGPFEADARTNFTPGLVMILFTLAVLLLCRRNFAAYGLNLDHWRENLKLGLLWGLVLVAGAGLLHVLGVRHLPGPIPPTMTEGAIYGLACLAALLALARLLRRQRTLLQRVPLLLPLLLLFLVLWLPLSFALQYAWPFDYVLLTVLWLVIGAACGEEIFCRGYIQSRINLSFGRPLRFLGVQFGAGLLVSSLLFGFLHALNTVDYFEHRFTLAWGFALTNLATGLLYGFLREATGSILAPVIAHATLDLLVIIPNIVALPDLR